MIDQSRRLRPRSGRAGDAPIRRTRLTAVNARRRPGCSRWGRRCPPHLGRPNCFDVCRQARGARWSTSAHAQLPAPARLHRHGAGNRCRRDRCAANARFPARSRDVGSSSPARGRSALPFADAALDRHRVGEQRRQRQRVRRVQYAVGAPDVANAGLAADRRPRRRRTGRGRPARRPRAGALLEASAGGDGAACVAGARHVVDERRRRGPASRTLTGCRSATSRSPLARLAAHGGLERDARGRRPPATARDSSSGPTRTASGSRCCRKSPNERRGREGDGGFRAGTASRQRGDAVQVRVDGDDRVETVGQPTCRRSAG